MQNWERSGAVLTPNELVLTFGSFTSVPIFVHIILILKISVQISTGNLLNVSSKSPGNLLGWICRDTLHMQVIFILHQTHNHASTSLLKFLQAGCFSCHPTISIKALKVNRWTKTEARYTLSVKTVVILDTR